MQYAALDVYHLADVFKESESYIKSTSYKLDILALRYALDFQQYGMPVLPEAVNKKYQENLDIIAGYKMPINVNSWQQVRPYIGSNKSDKLELATLQSKGNEKAAAVLKVRTLIKENSFLDKFDTTDNRIYGKFAPSARSGRFTCKDQNLEQIPRSTKGVFGLDPDTGRVLVYSDYAQLELRGACAVVGDKNMERLLRLGEDLHSNAAKILFGKDYTPRHRQIAKTANFNLMYGGGHNMLGAILIQQAGIVLSETELREIKKKWLRLWPDIANWQQRGIEAWREGLAWSTPLGRKYNAKMMTDQLNIQIQGFGAEVAKLAMHYMYPKLLPTANLVNFIHDSYIVECDIDDYEETAHTIADAMQEAWREGCKCTKIKDLPMPVDVFVGYNWGRIEKDYIWRLQQ